MYWVRFSVYLSLCSVYYVVGYSSDLSGEVRLLRAPAKRSIVNPVIQIPEGNSTLPLTNSTEVEDKSKSVKKELKDVLSGITLGVPSVQLPSPVNTTNKEAPVASITPKLPPVVQQTSINPPKEPLESSTPAINVTTNATLVDSSKNVTVSTKDKPESEDGAKKRGLIVFGSLGVLAAAYLTFKIYKRKKQQRNNDLSFYPNDNQQFKYGVLTSNDNDENLELSNIPQTIDSDDEEIEIFDLENKKFVDNERNNAKYSNQNKEKQFVFKDDVEILDLNLPGTSSDSDQVRSLVDDNLLNFDDMMSSSNLQNDDTVMPVNQSNKNANFKSKDDFFDIL